MSSTLYYKGKEIIVKELPLLKNYQSDATYLRVDKKDEETGEFWGLYEYEGNLYRGTPQQPADILAKAHNGKTPHLSAPASKTGDTMEEPEKLRELGKIGTGIIGLVAIIVIMVIALGGCGTTEYSPETGIDKSTEAFAEEPLSESAEEFSGMKRLGEQRENQLQGGYPATFYEYEDTVTGVHYLVFMRPDGIAMCPRYNADGTLYVSEVSE